MHLFFERGNRWHHRAEWMRWIALGYYRVLRGARGKGPIRPLLKQCKDCGVRFLTVANNHKRKDLRCPFGCREAHKKEQAKVRSTEYYQTPEGKIKREQLNRRRRGSKGATADRRASSEPPLSSMTGTPDPALKPDSIVELIDAKVIVLWLQILNPEKIITTEVVIAKTLEIVKWLEAGMKQHRFDFTEG
jgi:hypothetical protein